MFPFYVWYKEDLQVCPTFLLMQIVFFSFLILVDGQKSRVVRVLRGMIIKSDAEVSRINIVLLFLIIG